MNLHSRQWFLIHAASLTTYTSDELAILWDSFSSVQIDLLQEMCDACYKAGYKAAEEDR